MVPPSSGRISRVPPYSRTGGLSTRTGLSPAAARLSRRFRLSLRDHWPGPRSLATTCGVSVDVLSSGYLDVSVRRVRFYCLCIQQQIPPKRWVAPFGNPRINACSRLPMAYRNVLRPSSPLSAKASTRCPSYACSTHNECATRRRKPTRDQRQPARIRQRCIVMTQPAVSSREATALSGHPRSLILFTCQRSHIRPRADICFLSHRISYCRVTKGHSSSLCPSSWWRRTGSNRRPHACKARALPTELRPHGEGSGGTVVGQGRLELPTSRLSSARSNQLSY